ncbi:MAG TPA: thioredoxin domain-containing protein [Candidatus Paceibacterota bacterium]|nr:thioredoxin domain-containing protein [Candidatus Paceibacterota bacterium]
MQRSTFLVPIAIVIAGLLISVGIFYARGGNNPVPNGNPENVRPVSPEDHLIGNPDAPVIIVEYSDIDCAYCKEFQATLTQLMADHAQTGDVAWVYRHLPLVNAHPYAAEHAEAAECVAEQGGNVLFFRFIDALQENAPGSFQSNPEDYLSIVESLGVSSASFSECLQSDRMIDRVTKDFDNAIEAGANGTPYSVVLVRGSDPIPLSGALPYETMKRVLEEALSRATR